MTLRCVLGAMQGAMLFCGADFPLLSPAPPLPQVPEESFDLSFAFTDGHGCWVSAAARGWQPNEGRRLVDTVAGPSCVLSFL